MTESIYGMFGEDENKVDFEVEGTPVKVVETGSSGTDIHSGYIFEEYLETLQGTQAADIYDKMRRSDPKVKMVLSAMKNPIKGASWEVTEKGDETKEGLIQKAFIEHILFSDLGKTWKSFLHEALSCIDFGYSLFEITYKAELNHEVFGSYNGIKSLAFRSQRTIERWEVNRDGTLESVYQESSGDNQKNIYMNAKFLLHFALEKEGDNFEGISTLRPAYGPWLRKNNFLKMIAAGIEKYAIPIPVLEVPEGKQNSTEYKKAKESLKRYVSHQCNYIIVPFGWNMKLTTNSFDASKIREVINDENVEIVNSALANFLELGQSGSGSYSLSFDLSDFFLGGLEYVAEQIAETFNQKLIPDLIKLNFPSGKCLVELSAKGISDRAGEELAKIVDMLVKSNVITADDRLEESLRRRFGLPERDETTSRKIEADTPPPIPGAKQFSEDPEDVKKKSSDPVKEKIESDAKLLEEVMRKNLNIIGTEIVKQAVSHWNKSDESERVAPLKEYEFSTDLYTNELREELSRQYNTSVNQARGEDVELSSIKLSETEFRIKLSESDKLNQKALVRINGIVDELVQGNTQDLVKANNQKYIQSAEKINSVGDLDKALTSAIEKKIDGPLTTTGSLLNASNITNVARRDLFKEVEADGNVESYTWVNIDPVSAICKGITGTTLPADDPGVDTYWPPLHHNCKTYVVANIKGRKDNPSTQNGFTPTETEAKSISLAETGQAFSPCCC